MATTYRYMALATPTTILAISKQVPSAAGPITITVPPPTLIDVTLGNSTPEAKEDLDEYMSSIGYSYMATDPPPLKDGETVVWEKGAWTCINVAPIVAESADEESSTKSSFVQKVRNSFTSSSADAKYIIFYDAIIETSSSNCYAEVQLILDGSTVLTSVTRNPGGPSEQMKFSGHITPTAFGAGPHTVDVEYKKASGGGSVKIKEAKVTIWRVF